MVGVIGAATSLPPFIAQPLAVGAYAGMQWVATILVALEDRLLRKLDDARLRKGDEVGGLRACSGVLDIEGQRAGRTGLLWSLCRPLIYGASASGTHHQYPISTMSDMISLRAHREPLRSP